MSTDMSVSQARLPDTGPSDAALLEALLREAPFGFAFYDTDLCCRRVNRELADLAGTPVAGQLGQQPGKVLPEKLGSLFEATLRQVLNDGSSILHEELPLGGPDEHGRPTSWVASWFPCRDDSGRVTGAAVLIAEMTDYRRVEETVRRNEERYRSLVQASEQVVWVTTPAGEMMEDSPQWRRVTGQTSQEFYRDGWLGALHPDDREHVERAWHEALRAGLVFDCAYRVMNHSGGYRYYEAHAVPIVRGGEIIEWVGANTDVTSQRESDEMRGRLTEQLGAAALRTARLQQATSMLAEALTVEQVVQVIGEVGRSSIGTDRCAVALLNKQRQELHVVTDAMPAGSGFQGNTIALQEPGVMTMAIRDRRPFLAESQQSLRDQLPYPEIEPFLQHTDEQSWVGLPLFAAGAPLGALRFAFTRPHPVGEDERVFLEALAGQCALALERATLYEREHRTAETLQRSLLPDQLPKPAGLALGALYCPAAPHTDVGGDWYDAFQLPDGRLAVAAGDVMGKGVEAAAGMGRVRNALRALALTDCRPAAVMSGLERLFTLTEHDEQVTTVIYGVVDPAVGEAVISNAGHPPALIFPVDGPPQVTTTTPVDTPLGVPDERAQHHWSLPPGSTAVFYSDGLVENRKRGWDSGLQELEAVAAEAPPEVVADPDRLVNYLVERMLTGHEQNDDVTLLALRVRPSGE